MLRTPSKPSSTRAWWRAAVTLGEVGLSSENRIIHHDQDTVYTGYRWLCSLLIKHRARISFSENGAKGNTSMRSFNGHLRV